jgi:CDP-diacylglycerol--glycerol-3-phosphate 3-phosphatidyltransferase
MIPMKQVPQLLIWSRLAIGLFLLAFSFSETKLFAPVGITLVTLGLLTDIFDGIIARRLGVSTIHLRRLDSIIDQVFWLCIAAACYVRFPLFFEANATKIIILVSIEAFTYLLCYLKFRKEVATHAISSKLWTLLLFATLIQLIATSSSSLLFNVCFIVGIITRIEIILILLIIRQWTNDVPSVYHAVLLRRGRQIKRNKLFNG